MTTYADVIQAWLQSGDSSTTSALFSVIDDNVAAVVRALIKFFTIVFSSFYDIASWMVGMFVLTMAVLIIFVPLLVLMNWLYKRVLNYIIPPSRW